LDPKVFTGWTIHTLLLFGLCSLETLLSHTASDKLLLTRGITYKHDPNLDMKGQGLANMVASLFGGIPSTAVIVRSSANILSGARSRASALIVAGFTITSVVSLQPILSQMPTCALSGVLVAIGFQMIRNKETKTVIKVKDWTETVPMATAFSLLVAHDLLTGVACGVVTSAAILSAQRALNKLPLTFRWGWTTKEGEINGMELAGSLTFFSLSRIEEMVQRVLRKHVNGKLSKNFIVDCSKVLFMDLTSLEKFISVFDDLAPHGYTIEIVGLPPKIQKNMLVVDPHAKRYFSPSLAS